MHEDVNGPPLIRFGPFTLDGRSGELRNGPARLKVPDQSIAVLQALLEHPGRLVTREELRDRIWPPDTFVDFEAGLNAAVRRLREALNDSADAPRYVETLPRRGYRFIAPVEGALPAAPPAPDARPRPLVLAAVALIVIGAGIWISLRWNAGAPAAARAARPLPITSFPGLELDPAISPAGNLVAFAWEGPGGDNFDIYVRSIDGGSQLRLTSDAGGDHLPAWSPDGLRIAFVRSQSGKRVVFVMPALGGPEQQLFEAGPDNGPWFLGGWSYGLSWTPDGKHLVFGDSEGSTSAIFLYSLEDGQRRQLTRPPANFGDINPVVSPDGRYLGFVRMKPRSFGGKVFLQPLDRLQATGDPVQLTNDHLALAFDWTRDSGSVIYDSPWGMEQSGLWRIAVGGGAPVQVLREGRAGRPSVARAAKGIVYQNAFVDSNIWELRTPPSPSRESSGDPTFRVIASTLSDLDPQFSPDGARIVFGSSRSGNRELWVSNRDGSEPKKLTTFESGFVGSPRWSADGKWIAFDASQTGTWNLQAVPASGGPSRTLIADTFNNVRPCWSLDGRWIYFGSDRTGDWQIWKVPSAGGTPVQVTRGGGLEAAVSWDGRRVYYAKPVPIQGIWEVPADGGQEIQVVSRGRALNFDVAENGIFMLDVAAKPQALVEMFSFATRQIVPVARLPPGLRFSNASYLAVTRDGRSMLYVQYDQWLSDIEMLPEFR